MKPPALHLVETDPLPESATETARRSIADAHSARRTLEDGIAALRDDLVSLMQDAVSLENLHEGRRGLYQQDVAMLIRSGLTVEALRKRNP